MDQQSRMGLLQGALDFLIQRTLQVTPMHGWAISERIQQISEDVLQVNQGSLYPTLASSRASGLDQIRMGISELGRRARFCKQLECESRNWDRLTHAIGRVPRMA